jgi:hypothetical protein
MLAIAGGDGLFPTILLGYRCGQGSDDADGELLGILGDTMATTKATLVAGRISSIEAALDEMERELEHAEGSRKQMLEKWVTIVHHALRKHRSHTSH